MSKWKLVVKFEHGFHVGSGYRYAGRVDKRLLRDGDGLPFIPGSALKGRIRHAAREVAEALGHTVCARYCLPGSAVCPICRLFGSPFVEGKLVFSDARCGVQENPSLGLAAVSQEAVPRIWGERNGVAIDRRRGAARSGGLFSTECAPEGLELHASVEGDLEEKGDLDEKDEWLLLQAAVKAVCSLGADASRGLGGCRCQIS